MVRKTGNYELHTHEFPPFWRPDSRILILGSFPSVKSREQQFYYGHPQNRFWRVLAGVYDEPVPTSREQKEFFLERNHVALWDVIDSCEIIGSSDSSIRNVKVTELNRILDACEIQNIYTNGATAHRLYEKYQQEICGRPAVRLPSTSPANAACTFSMLLEAWKRILETEE